MPFWIKDGVLKKGLWFSDATWVDYPESMVDFVVPEGVTEIGDDTFSGIWTLESIRIANSVKRIGKNAFLRCAFLRSITIPEGVTEIDDTAFMDCTSLQRVYIADSVKSIDGTAFLFCGALTDIYIKNIRLLSLDCKLIALETFLREGAQESDARWESYTAWLMEESGCLLPENLQIPGLLDLMLRAEAFSEKTLELSLKETVRLQNTEMTARLLEYRNTHFGDSDAFADFRL